MGYKYQANAFDGASAGYIKYNISPDTGETVAPGETITVTGEAYYRDAAAGAIHMILNMASGYGYIHAVFPRAISRGVATQFTLTYTLPEEVLDRMGSGRTFVSELSFGLLWGSELSSGGVNFTATTTQAITIIRYRLSPAITAAKFSRCRQTDSGWQRWDEGLYVLTDSLQARISEAASLSDVTVCRVEYADETGENIAVELDPAALIAGYSETEPVLFADRQFLLGREYALTLKMGDAYDVSEIEVTVPRAFCNFHLSGAETGGAAFGMFSGATDGNPMLETAYPLRAYAGIFGADGKRLDGNEVQEYEAAELGAQFEPYDAANYPLLFRVGKIVFMHGKLTPTASISGSTTEHTMFTLPRAYWPVADVYQVCQGSTAYKWLLHVSPDGAVTFSRYSGTSYASAAAGTWLVFSATWIASEPDAEVRVTYPASAMTGESSADCVASASTEYGTDYPVWRAFNHDWSTAYGWASKAADAAPWLQLQMPRALKNISVTLTNRTRSADVKGPIAGTVLGSNDGDAWTEIGAFSGFDGLTSGGVAGTVECGNATAYRYVRVAFTAWEGGKDLSVGEMSVTGEISE